MNTVFVFIYHAKDGWRWNMKRRGRIIAESGEAYNRRSSCKRTVTRLIETEKHQFKFVEVPVK